MITQAVHQTPPRIRLQRPDEGYNSTENQDHDIVTTLIKELYRLCYICIYHQQWRKTFGFSSQVNLSIPKSDVSKCLLCFSIEITMSAFNCLVSDLYVV